LTCRSSRSPLTSATATTVSRTPLAQQFRELTDDDAAANALAAGIASIIPRPENAVPPPVDVDTMEALIGDRLTPAQRHCMRRVRELLGATGSARALTRDAHGHHERRARCL
jgi:hypothetical protein